MAIGQDRVTSLDTSDAAHRRQIEAWIAMGPEQRVRLAASMSDDVRRVAHEGHARAARSHTGARRSAL